MTVHRPAHVDAGALAALWVLLEVIGCASIRRAPGVLFSRLGMVRHDRRLRQLCRTGAHLWPSPACTLLIVDRTYPDPTRDAGSDRTARIAQLADTQGWQTTIASLFDRRIGSALPADSPRVGVAPPQPCDDDRLRRAIESANVIWLSRPQVAARLLPVVRACHPDGAVVFDTVDVHHLRLQRQSDLRGSFRLQLMAALMRSLERRLMRGSELTVVVTADEQRLVKALVPDSQVRVIPTIHAIPLWDVPPVSARRKTLLFVGGFSHPPNVDAVDILVRSVMPLVWAADSSVTLDVAGSGNPPARLASADPRVRMLGWVEDLEPKLREAMALVAPIRFGAGMKGKVGLALAAGLPVVTTRVGAEGIGLDHGDTALIGETPEEIAACCLQLIGDPDLWGRLSSNGQALVRRTLAPDAVAPQLAAVLNELTKEGELAAP